LKKTTSFQLLSVLFSFQILLIKLIDFLNELRSSCHYTLVFMKDFLLKYVAFKIRFLKEIAIFFKSFKLFSKFFTKFKIFSDFYCNWFANFIQSALTVLYNEFNELLIISASFIDILKCITSQSESVVISSSICQFFIKASIADVVKVKLITEEELLKWFVYVNSSDILSNSQSWLSSH